VTAPRRIRKAVLPVAGLGTRFLPGTKSLPKEMLNLVDRPLIDYVVAEAHEAGIEHIVFVTGRNKGAIEDYFDHAYELEDTLLSKGKTDIARELQDALPAPGAMSFVRQQRPQGLGHAVWCARDVIGDEPFAVLLPDEVMQGKPGCLAQLVETYNARGGNIIAVEPVDRADAHRYGIVALSEPMDADGAAGMSGMVEKPKGEPPSLFRISGRYILQPEIFAELERQEPGAGGEIQLTDAMAGLQARQPFTAKAFAGRSHDCGDKLGYLTATFAFALDRPEFAEALRARLRDLLAAG
jgi:UTP--glucose-1-phosphate uridylyltransferase